MSRRRFVANLGAWAASAVALLATLACQSTAAQTLTVLSPPSVSSVTTRDFVNVLGRTEPGNRVTVAGQDVPVYSTGVFVRDRVALQAGDNTLAIEVKTPAGAARQLSLNVRRDPPAPPPQPVTDRLYIDAASIQPSELHQLSERETVDVAFSGTPGMDAEARWGEGPWFALTETSPGRYRARLLLRDDFDRIEQPVQLRLSAPKGSALAGETPVVATTRGAVGLWRSEGVRLYVTGANGVESTELTHGLHDVRLGGPNLAELPAGVVLRVTGRVGEQLRVQLAPGVDGWASAAALTPAPAGTVLPPAVVTSISLSGHPGGDQIDLAWPTARPYSARSTTSAEGWPLIELELFGTHHATTWITHKANARWVREVTADQAGPDRVKVRITLQQPRLWGWSVQRIGGTLRLTVSAPPAPARAAASPLAGLRIAVEAGHGGPANLGAIGPTGTPEKDINRWTSDALRSELEAAGAEVVDIRPGDESPTLRERARRVMASGAQLFVSIHANAASVDNGYLRAAGTGTFYKHAHSRAAAAAVQRHLLQQSGLPDLGLIGNFNYTPIRLVTQMPAILVEQAFVSNPAEEAKLLDPAFRAQLAQSVRMGLEDFVRAALKDLNQETRRD